MGGLGEASRVFVLLSVHVWVWVLVGGCWVGVLGR